MTPPLSSYRYCTTPNCSNLVRGTGKGGSRCTTCNARAKASRDKQRRDYDRSRPTSHERYGSEWRAVSREHLRQHPWCEPCRRQSTRTLARDVDHIDGNRTNNSPDNLMSLCRSHHASKTRKDAIAKRTQERKGRK